MSITPIGLARLHCANFENDGSCAGLDFDPVTGRHVVKPLPKCLLGTLGVRCPYFEQALMPMNSGQWIGLQTPKEHQDFAGAVKAYQLAANIGTVKRRKCECGRELEPRRRLCYICAVEKRRATYRKANGIKDSSTTVNP